jgi:hypothetical protein
MSREALAFCAVPSAAPVDAGELDVLVVVFMGGAPWWSSATMMHAVKRVVRTAAKAARRMGDLAFGFEVWAQEHSDAAPARQARRARITPREARNHAILRRGSGVASRTLRSH